MARQTVLEVTPREIAGKATKRLRRAGIIPANIYGYHEASLAVQVDALAFERLQRAHGARSVLSLHLPNAPAQMALIRHVQRDPIAGKVLHVDFSRVSLDESIEVKVPLNFVGVSLAVKNLGGVLLHLIDALPVECRASDIVENIVVDLALLEDIDATIYARDIKLPAHYALAIDAEEPIVKVIAPRTELPGATATVPAETGTAPVAGNAENAEA